MDQLSLEEIVRRCQNESGQTRQEEAGYCYELFRRALEGQDSRAWGAVYDQYGRLVGKWLQSAAKDGLPSMEVEDLQQDALTKFWRMGQKRHPLADYFEHVGSLLSYLKQCTVSTYLDYMRKVERETRWKRVVDLDIANNVMVEDHAVAFEATNYSETGRSIVIWLRNETKDADEQLILKLAFEHGLKANEIVAKHPHQFPNNRTVYRIKDRLIKRAQRHLHKEAQKDEKKMREAANLSDS